MLIEIDVFVCERSADNWIINDWVNNIIVDKRDISNTVISSGFDFVFVKSGIEIVDWMIEVQNYSLVEDFWNVLDGVGW